jgi:hypothetical protein
MLNPFELIPKNIDPTLRLVIIGLVSIQLLAFFLYLIVMIYGFLQNKKEELNKAQLIELVEKKKEK